MSRAATEYRYEKLTWPEINDAVDLGKVCILPCGAVEQHGPQLEHAEPRPGGAPHQSRDRRRVRARRVVEPADRGQDVPAEVAAKQIPWRLRSRLRTRNQPVPVSRWRQRPQGPDQERRHQL